MISAQEFLRFRDYFFNNVLASENADKHVKLLRKNGKVYLEVDIPVNHGEIARLSEYCAGNELEFWFMGQIKEALLWKGKRYPVLEIRVWKKK